MPVPRKRITLAAGVLVLLLSTIVVIGVFRLRSGSGDVFAPYSTFRADPLGTMAFFSALQDIDGLTVERFMRPFDELPDGKDALLFIPGASLSPDPVEALEAVEAFAIQGGRVVIALRPLDSHFYLDNLQEMLADRDAQEDAIQDRLEKKQPPPDEDEEYSSEAKEIDEDDSDSENDSAISDPEASDTVGDAPDPEDVEEGKEGKGTNAKEHKILDISERWPFTYGFDEPDDGFYAVPEAAASSTEAQVTWLSGLYFQTLDEHWKPIYIRPGGTEKAPWVTVMERKMGSGTIVLCSDSFFLSNEALREHRASSFLHWLVGPSSRAIFSEVHLGTEQKDRIMTLVRRYRLHGFFMGLVLLALLFVWKNASSLLPRVDRTSTRTRRPASAIERSHQDGLDNLLARFVPAERLVETCVDEWLQQYQNNPKAQTLKNALENAKAGGITSRDDIVAAYNRLAAEMHKHK